MTAAERDPAFGGSGGGGVAVLPPTASAGDLSIFGNASVADGIVSGTPTSRAAIAATMANPGSFGERNALSLTITGKGTSATGKGGRGLSILAQDSGSAVNKTITGAANNGSGLIRITSTGHTFSTGDEIAVYGVGGATQANGAWTITVIDANTFDLQGSAFSSAYTSGGTATNRPYFNGIYIGVKPTLARGGLTGTAAFGDDVDGIAIQNIGTGQAVDGFYLAASTTVSGADWTNGMAIAANCSFAGFLFAGTTAGYGLDLDGNHGAVYTGSGAAIRLPNNVPGVVARNAANNADVELFRMDNLDELEILAPTRFLGQALVNDATNFAFGTTTGTKIGTGTTQKIGFWNVTPVVRPTGWAAATNTKLRTTFDTTTVTLPNLAARVGALLDDLIAIGLIGA